MAKGRSKTGLFTILRDLIQGSLFFCFGFLLLFADDRPHHSDFRQADGALTFNPAIFGFQKCNTLSTFENVSGSTHFTAGFKAGIERHLSTPSSMSDFTSHSIHNSKFRAEYPNRTFHSTQATLAEEFRNSYPKVSSYSPSDLFSTFLWEMRLEKLV